MAEWKFTIRLTPSANAFGPVPVGEDGVLVDTPSGKMISFGPEETSRIKESIETEGRYNIDVKTGESTSSNEATRQLKLSTLALKRMALEDLRDILEDGEGPHANTQTPPSWDYPIAFFRSLYPLTQKIFPPSTMTDPIEVGRWFADLMSSEWGKHGETLSTLEAMTRYAALVRWQGKVSPVLPSIFFDRYAAMTSEERAEFRQEWFSITAHADRFTERGDKAVPGEDASVHVVCGDKNLRAAIVFDVFPLFINAEKGHAFYLIRAGLVWEGSLGSPGSWEPEERAELWRAIFKSIDLQAAQIQGEPTPEYLETGIVDIFIGEGGEILVSPKMVATAEVVKAAELIEELQAKGRAEAFAGSATERLVDEQEARDTFSANDGVSAELQDVFSIAVGPASYSVSAFNILKSNSNPFRLPRHLSSMKRWSAIASEHIANLQNDLGLFAFSNVDEHGNPTKPRLIRKGDEIFLSKAEEKALRLQYGVEGFLEEYKGGALAIYRCHEDESGKLVEHRLAWDKTTRLFGDGIAREKSELEALRNDLSTQLDLGDDYKKRLDQALENVRVADHCHILRAFILGEVQNQRSTVVELRASDLARLLWGGSQLPRDWLKQMRDALDSLRSLVLAYKVDGKGEGVMQFITEWHYVAAGKGARTDGLFYAAVSENFQNHIPMFASKEKIVRGGISGRHYDFTLKLTAEQRKQQERSIRLPKGAFHTFFDMELTAEQRSLSLWISAHLTKRKDPVRRGFKTEKLHPKHTDANEPRFYGTAFCPLLPEGKQFISPLGAFANNAEAGRTLFGTQTKGTKKSGGRTGGLLEEMGHKLPPGRAYGQRKAIVERALSDIRAVVESHYGGIIAGRIGEGSKDEWFSVEEMQLFDEQRLRSVKFYFFLPFDAYEQLTARAEKKIGKRLTPSVEEAKAARHSQIVEVVRERGEEESAAPLVSRQSLPALIHETLARRSLKRADFARIFGVSKMTVSHWLHGLKEGEDPANAMKIAPDLVPLIMEWVETGKEPTAEELAALPSRQKRARAS